VFDLVALPAALAAGGIAAAGSLDPMRSSALMDTRPGCVPVAPADLCMERSGNGGFPGLGTGGGKDLHVHARRLGGEERELALPGDREGVLRVWRRRQRGR
jgi:hypothetical protein